MSSTCCTWVAAAELFGTEVRTTGHSSASAVARLGGIIVPFIVFSDIAFPYIGVIMLVVHYFVTILVMQTPETQGKEMGKAHEEYASKDKDRDDLSASLLHSLVEEIAFSVSNDSF